VCILKGAIYDDEIKCILRVALLGPLEHGRVFCLASLFAHLDLNTMCAL
jgi:hypothetical protein